MGLRSCLNHCHSRPNFWNRGFGWCHDDHSSALVGHGFGYYGCYQLLVHNCFLSCFLEFVHIHQILAFSIPLHIFFQDRMMKVTSLHLQQLISRHWLFLILHFSTLDFLLSLLLTRTSFHFFRSNQEIAFTCISSFLYYSRIFTSSFERAVAPRDRPFHTLSFGFKQNTLQAFNWTGYFPPICLDYLSWILLKHLILGLLSFPLPQNIYLGKILFVCKFIFKLIT